MAGSSGYSIIGFPLCVLAQQAHQIKRWHQVVQWPMLHPCRATMASWRLSGRGPGAWYMKHHETLPRFFERIKNNRSKSIWHVLHTFGCISQSAGDSLIHEEQDQMGENTDVRLSELRIRRTQSAPH